MMMRTGWCLVFIVFLLASACSFTRKVQTGLQAYEVKQYAVAVKLFENEYAASRNPQDKARLAFLSGESYTRLLDPASASTWYLKAHEDGFGPDALDRYAATLKQQEKYPEAIRAYEELLKASPNNASYRSSITLCRQAMDWKKNANADYTITPVAFNSPAADYSPQPVGPGLILFTSDRDNRQHTGTYLWTGRDFSDLYLANTNTGLVSPFDDRINTQENEGTASMSADGSMIVFTRCFPGQTYDAWCKLMVSYRRGNNWSDPEVLPFVRDKINYGHPALAAGGTTLFFSCDAPEGFGGHDLYFTQRDVRGQWTEPANLGPVINTMGDEQYPTVYGDTLYFSSNHHPGLGGLDIFKTWLDAKGNWVPPLNLKAPINSGADDFGLAVDTFAVLPEGVLLQGYFSSTRGGVSRMDDIYAFSLIGTTTPEVVTATTPPVIKEVEQIENTEIYLSLSVVEPVYEIPDDPNSPKIGTRPLPNGPVIMTEGRTDQRFKTDAQGTMLLKLEWNTPYIFTGRYRDHLATSYALNTGEVHRTPGKRITTVNHVMELEPIFKGKEIVLDNIFYDYDEWAIRNDARPALDELALVLKTNPAIRIQLSSHTDCRGTEEYNLELSQKRAQSAIEYLISQGIVANRLVALGLGESSPAVNCICEQCTEDQHQTNRRTTFTILD